jgi:hypothetical protein
MFMFHLRVHDILKIILAVEHYIMLYLLVGGFKRTDKTSTFLFIKYQREAGSVRSCPVLPRSQYLCNTRPGLACLKVERERNFSFSVWCLLNPHL